MRKHKQRFRDFFDSCPWALLVQVGCAYIWLRRDYEPPLPYCYQQYKH